MWSCTQSQIACTRGQTGGVDRKSFQAMLWLIERLRIRFFCISNERMEREAHITRRNENTATKISVDVDVLGDWHARIDNQFFFAAQIAAARRMYVKHQDHRRWGGDPELNVETDLDDH